MKKKYISPKVDVITFVSNPLMDTISVPINNNSGETIDGDDFGAKENRWSTDDVDEVNLWGNKKFNYNPWKD